MNNIIGLELEIATEKRTRIEVEEIKRYSIFEWDDKERVREMLDLALTRLPQEFQIKVSFFTRTNPGIEGFLQVICHFDGQIELRKALGTMFDTIETYERKSKWIKRIKDFIEGELDELKELHGAE